MYIIDNLTDNNHDAEFRTLALDSEEIIIISPFCFNDFSIFFNKIQRAKIKCISLITTLHEDEVITKIGKLQSFLHEASIHNIKADILINNKLHGKIYIFKKEAINTTAIITSANLTDKGMSHNHEWGCCILETSTIDLLEQKVLSTIEYELTDDVITEIRYRVDKYLKDHSEKEQKKPHIKISDLIIKHRFNIFTDLSVRIFLKPIGSIDNPIYEGDYSGATKQFFSKRRPAAVRANDFLISYAVGAKKIVSIYKVRSKEPINTGDKNDRWPWYVEVENITPKLGVQWVSCNLFITKLANEYVDTYGLNITNRGGKTLGALQWGADKIRLDYDFGIYLFNIIMSRERVLK